MNIKAERIEKFLQVVNRSLLLVTSGQLDEGSALEARKLQKVDAGVFGSDKFAFEMVHFLKSATKSSKAAAQTMASHWEKIFLEGLETLLVECAVVADDVERDCFVSRVYCWFTEKLAERREFPRAGSHTEALGTLRSIVQDMKDVTSTHTLAGIDKQHQQLVQQQQLSSPGTAADRIRAGGAADSAAFVDFDMPPITMPTHTSLSTRRNQLPVYVRHHLPSVFREGSEYVALLPKVPDEAFGLHHHVPTSETEKSMHELWLARRRQEAFDWKTQKHMALVLDRMELHRSRLESDALRRQESNAYLNKKPSRPHSAGEISARFAPHLRANSPKRPHGEYPSSQSLAAHFRRPDSPEETLAADSEGPVENPPGDDAPGEEKEEPAAEAEAVEEAAPEGPADPESQTVVTRLQGRDEEAPVPKLSRTAVQRSKSQRFLPMRYKLEPLESFTRNYERQELYMQLSDSDDDEDKDRLPRLQGTLLRGATGTGGGAAKGNKGGGKAAKGPVASIKFKRDKPVVRDRPQSSRQFREVALNDTELKVHYRHSNYRRMPLTEEHQEWLQGRESEREKKSNDIALHLVEAAAAKEEKAKGKAKEGGGKDKDKGGKDKGGGKGGKAATAAHAGTEDPPKVKCKYSSAAQFMSAQFPSFDQADDHSASHGPMRALQLVECARIMGAMEAFGEAGSVSERALRKALVVPQDKPEAIALENLRDSELEGLWRNPMPFEFWRKVVIAKAKKGGGGKKGKKG